MENKLCSIHPSAMLGANVVVENFATIAADVIIGDNTWIGPHATILSGSRIGNNCQIFPGAVVGSTSQDKKKEQSSPFLIVGDHTIIREFVTLNKGTFGDTLIGSHVLLMAYVHVAHDCIIEDHVIVSNATQLAGHVHLNHHAVIGGTAAIHQFMQIGSYSMVASKSIVRKHVPPFVMVAREPLRYCGINKVALQRNHFTKEQCKRIKNCYYMIYQHKMPLTAALKATEQELPDSLEKKMILSFIRNVNQHIVKRTHFNH